MRYKLFLILNLLVLFFFLPVFTAFSQGLPAPFRLQLVSSKHFYAPDDSFQLNITVIKGDPKPGRVDIILQIYQRLGLSEEQETPLLYRRRWSRYYVSSGNRDLKFIKSISSLKLSEGTYPVRVSIWQKGQEIAQARTAIVVVDEHPPNEYLPVGLILVWPLHDRARFNHEGIFIDNKIAEDSDVDINSPGVYYRHLTALAQYPSIQVTVATTPLLIEQMGQMKKGYRILRNNKVELKTTETKDVKDISIVLDRYSELFSSGQAALLPSPYAFASLQILADNGWDTDAHLQIAKGREVIIENFKLDSLAPSLYLPGLSLTSDSIAYLAREGIENTILSGKAFKRIIGNEEGDLYSSYRIQDLDSNRVTVVFRDDNASEALNYEESEEAVQKLLGRLAEVYLHNPERQKIVAVVVEPENEPSRELLENLYRYLQMTPWIKTVTLEDGIALVPPASKPLMLLDSPIEDTYISVQYRKRLISSRKAYGLFAKMVENNNYVRRRLERELLIAEGWDWTKSPSLDIVNLGLDFVEDIEKSVSTELKKVRILSQGTIALSSLSGKIPIAVFSKADYPFKMTVKVDGNNFGFPKGNSRVVEINPKENIFSFSVTAYRPGVFPLKASVSSGSDIINQRTFTIRATSFTRTILFITALLVIAVFLYFFIRFYVHKLKS